MRQRSLAIAIFWALLLCILAWRAPGFFEFANIRDIAIANAPALIVAMGMTVVIISGEIDVSVGSQFAVASVIAGTLAKAGVPLPLTALLTVAATSAFGCINGAIVTALGVPSIVATLAAMAFWREVLRWITQGAWVQGIPANFQWMGLAQARGEFAILAAVTIIFAAMVWSMRNVQVGRAVYAVGSARESARLVGISVTGVTFGVFALLSALTGLAALLDSVRFSEVQSSAGAGLELKAISAVVIGGTSIAGGKGNLWGTLLGASVLAVIAPALTFLGINAFWEKAIQGAIILGAVILERATLSRRHAG